MITVHVRGLDGFQHDLVVSEDRLLDGIHTLTSELADETEAGARTKASREKLTGAAMNSIRARGPVVEAGVGIEHYGFADFGGKVGKNRSIHRRYIKGGRYLYPTVRGLGVVKQADAMVDKATKDLQ